MADLIKYEHMKYCTSYCKKLLPLSDFYFLNKSEGKLESRCKLCKREYQKKNAKRFYQRDLAKKCTYDKTKVCTGSCKKERPVEDFWLKSKKSGRRDSQCKFCRTKDREPKKEQRSATNKSWYAERGGKEWHKKYQEEYKPIRNARNKERRQTDIHYKIKETVRSRIYDVLKKWNIITTNKIRYLGTNILVYEMYLEAQFDETMSWENQDEWEIDHVKPCDSFIFTSDEDESVYECFNWKNTRPMIKKENTEKSNKVDWNVINEHKKLVKTFMETFDIADEI